MNDIQAAIAKISYEYADDGVRFENTLPTHNENSWHVPHLILLHSSCKNWTVSNQLYDRYQSHFCVLWKTICKSRKSASSVSYPYCLGSEWHTSLYPLRWSLLLSSCRTQILWRSVLPVISALWSFASLNINYRCKVWNANWKTGEVNLLHNFSILRMGIDICHFPKSHKKCCRS